jgi:hypothetical protein
VAVTLKVTAAPELPVASALIFAGRWRVGSVVSTKLTVTEKLADPVLPAPSVAEHVTVVVPTEKFDPDPGEQEGAKLPATASLAEPDPKVTVLPPALDVDTETSAGGVTTGSVVSTTCTVKEPTGAESASTQSTVVSPTAKRDPGGGVHAKPPSSYPTFAPPGPVASAVALSPSAARRADASGVAQSTTSASTGTNHLTLILGDPLLKVL